MEVPPLISSPEHPKSSTCSECDAEISEGAKFCPECGARQVVSSKSNEEDRKGKIRIPERSSEKKPEKTVKVPANESELDDSDSVDEEDISVDFSKIDPEKDWECFGQIEPGHVECKTCPFRVKCAEKAGVELEDGN